MATLAQPRRRIVSTRQLLYTLGGILALVLLGLFVQNQMGERPPARLVQSIITGLLVGGVYSLIALGIVIINKASGVFNFAHGWMILFGGLIFYSFFSAGQVSPLAAVVLSAVMVVMVVSMTGWRDLLKPRTLLISLAVIAVLTLLMSVGGPELKFVRAITGAMVGGVLLGLVIERFTIRPLIGQPLFAMVLMTLALAELLNGFTQLVWGSVELPLPVFANPDGSSLATIKLDGLKDALGGVVVVRTELLIVFGLALVAFAVFVAFFRFTNVGLAMRATAENQRLAQSIGLRVRVILAVSWALAALLATTSGVLQGSASSLSLNMPLLALLAFPAVLLGGLESVGGALVGGLVIGLVQVVSDFLFPGTQAGTELAPYLLLMVVLVIKPDGLFGEKRIERI